MKRTILIALAFLFAAGIAMPPAAEARVFVGVGVGGCCGGYYGGYPYPAYYAPYYVAPPPVVYAVPPAPSVYYAQPAATVVTTAAPPPMEAAPPPAPVPQSSAAFVDSQGRTCRHVQITSAADTVCLQPDGSWRTVQ